MDGLSESVLPCISSPENSKRGYRSLVHDGELQLYPAFTIYVLHSPRSPSVKTYVVEHGPGRLT